MRQIGELTPAKRGDELNLRHLIRVAVAELDTGPRPRIILLPTDQESRLLDIICALQYNHRRNTGYGVDFRFGSYAIVTKG